MPAPKFATARDPSRPTRGGREARFAAAMLGQPYMPHQRLIADVAGELVRNEQGLWVPAYKIVVVTEQRQSGKSHQSMAGNGERCFSVPRFRSWYTAQTGQDARDQFLKFEEENIRGTALEPFVKVKRGRGEEVMTFPNGSTIRPHPPTEEKLHGKQSNRNDIDEAWAFSEDEGKALMQAIAPTQLTRPDAQTFIWSAGGTPASTWLASLVARGRDGDPDIAYFEWAIPDDADPEDFDVILAHHPAAGRTISRDSLRALRAAFKDDPAGWARAAGNRWTEVIGGAITAEQWEAVRWPDPIPDDAPLAYGAARATDGSHVAIAAAAQVDGPDGPVTVVELLDVLPTAYMAAEHVLGWATDGALAVAPGGPSASLHRDLVNLNARRLLPMTAQDESAAVGNVLDSFAPRAIRWRRHPDLDAARQIAGTRNTGDGGKAWARLAAGGSVAPLEAGTLAAWALRHGPKAKGIPRIITAD